MDWAKVRRRLRQVDTPWERNKGRFFLDTTEEADVHMGIADKILRPPNFDDDYVETYDHLGVLTDTLRSLLSCASSDDDSHPPERGAKIVELITKKGFKVARQEVLTLLASEWHCRKYHCYPGSNAYKREQFARIGSEQETRAVHEAGVLSKMPRVDGDVALFAHLWLAGAKGFDPMECCYPVLEQSNRWTDAFVRYVDPAAKMIAAFRIGLSGLPEYMRAVTELEACKVENSLTEEHTLLGERGLNWWIHGQQLRGVSKSCQESVEACRRKIAEAQEREGMTEEVLLDRLNDRFPRENTWVSLDAALGDGFRPFPLRSDEEALLPEALLADLWNEHFGELAIQWEVMRRYDRITECDVRSTEPYEVLRRIERSLHSTIIKRLKGLYGNDRWWPDSVPSKTRKDCADRYEDENCCYSKESYMCFIDLAEIVKKNWSNLGNMVEASLGVTGKKGMNNWFTELNNLRNLVAHPLRGDPSDEQLSYLLDCDRKVSALTARLDADCE